MICFMSGEHSTVSFIRCWRAGLNMHMTLRIHGVMETYIDSGDYMTHKSDGFSASHHMNAKKSAIDRFNFGAEYRWSRYRRRTSVS